MVAGNWKMNKTLASSSSLINDLGRELAGFTLKENCQVVVCPPAIYLLAVKGLLEVHQLSYVGVGAQNCHHLDFGAYTGEVSATMLQSLGIDYVLVGHSERREYFSEQDSLLKLKVEKAIDNGLTPIFCCGEKLEVREKNQHFELVKKQIIESLFELTAQDFAKVIVAYEPVWAIGTGVTASPAQAQEMHAFIRSTISEQYGSSVADNTTILYGGSCKPHNAAELFGQTDVDGGLIGGASLKAKDFAAIIACL